MDEIVLNLILVLIPINIELLKGKKVHLNFYPSLDIVQSNISP